MTRLEALIIAATIIGMGAYVIYLTWEIESPLLECEQRHGVECELVARPIKLEGNDGKD